VGDFRDPAVCPGPFDVVIERRTVQLFPDDDRANALQLLADRLDGHGIFLSHCHDARWRPPAARVHLTEPWFEENGFVMDQSWGRLDSNPAWVKEQLVAWIQMTTG
jgi:hypothetical protein